MPFDNFVTGAIARELDRSLSGGKVERVYQPERYEILLHINVPPRAGHAKSDGTGCNTADAVGESATGGRAAGESVVGGGATGDSVVAGGADDETTSGGRVVGGSAAGETTSGGRAIGRSHHDLLVSAQGSHPYIYLSELKSANPQSPPAFCMLLRKHLIGARVERVFRVGRERIIRIEFNATDELGVRGRKTLLFEIMGKHSNLMLLDENDVVLDSIKRVYADMSRVRQTLPGIAYTPPPPGKGIGPLMEAENASGKPLSYYEGLEEDDLYAPQIIYGEGGAMKDFYVFSLDVYSDLSSSACPSVSSMLEKYYEKKETGNRMAQKSSDLRQVIKNDLDKLYLKKQRLLEDVEKAKRADKFRIKGELLTSNIYKLSRGMKEAEIEDYGAGAISGNIEDHGAGAIPENIEAKAITGNPDGGNPQAPADAPEAVPIVKAPADDPGTVPIVKIALDPLLTPAQNAQRYFKKYAKAKTALTEKAKQLELAERDIGFLESYKVFIENAEDTDDIDGLREELTELGYVKRRGGKKAKRSVKKQYVRYESGAGLTIYVGRNNRENDELTLKKARSDDLWLHTKDIPGSHVILVKRAGGRPSEKKEPGVKNAAEARPAELPQGFDEASIREAAQIAAYYSKARQSESVPVDYCLVKYVKKPAGAKPGMVIFTHNKTLYTTPKLP